MERTPKEKQMQSDLNLIYKEIISRVSYSPTDYEELEEAKLILYQNINEAFSNIDSYKVVKFIGSAATGNCTKWKKDLDAIIITDNFNRTTFREYAKRIKGLDHITFAEECRIVKDKLDAKQGDYEVSIGVVENGNPSSNLSADLTHHPDFSEKHLPFGSRGDVILVKVFLKNIGIYGKGIGGFACEQIIAHYGCFDKFLQKIAEGRPIFIDFSQKYTGPKGPVVISYPYCGLDNLACITKEEFSKMVNYARTVLREKERFLEDSLETITKIFWEGRAKKYSTEDKLSLPDIHLNKKENNNFKKIIDRVQGQIRILDLGCANGNSTIAINNRRDAKVIGVDINTTMLGYARKLREDGKFSFLAGYMQKLPFKDCVFDVVYAKRSLSNLPSKKTLERTIQEVSRVLRDDGLFIISDLFIEGYKRLNTLREKKGSSHLREPYHCTPLQEETLKSYLEKWFIIEDAIDFSSTYYYLSRVTYPKLASSLGISINPESMIHHLFTLLPALGGIGMNKIYIARKWKQH